MNAIAFLTGLILLAGLPEVSYWFVPDKFAASKGESIVITAQQGENFMGNAYALPATAKASLRVYNVPAHTLLNEKNDVNFPLTYTPTQEGCQLLSIETNLAARSVTAEELDALIKDFDLTEFDYSLQRINAKSKSIACAFTTYHKLYVKAGDATTPAQARSLALPLEIVPSKNPLLLKRNEPVQFNVLENGKPLFGARVKIWNRHSNRTTLQHIYTEQDGSIRTHISNPGLWMVAVVTVKPSSGSDNFYLRYSTLVFSIQ